MKIKTLIRGVAALLIASMVGLWCFVCMKATRLFLQVDSLRLPEQSNQLFHIEIVVGIVVGVITLLLIFYVRRTEGKILENVEPRHVTSDVSGDEEVTQMQTILVTQRGDDFHAGLEGSPGVWAAGRSAYEAVGDLVMHHPEVTGLLVKVPKQVGGPPTSPRRS